MQVRERRRGTEGAGQPRPYRRADHAFVEKAVGGEVGEPVLAEVEGGHGDERRHQRLHHVEAAVVRHVIADMVEPLVDAGLGTDAGRLGDVARPALDRVAAAEPHVERAPDIALRAFRSEEHTSELQSLMRSSYAGVCLKKKKKNKQATMGYAVLTYMEYTRRHVLNLTKHISKVPS